MSQTSSDSSLVPASAVAPEIEQHPLIGRTVSFQTGPCSYGEGRVEAVFPDTDRVLVIDEEGMPWRGSLDQIELVEGDATN